MKYGEKERIIKSYNEKLVKAVKADLSNRRHDSDYLFGETAGMMHMAYMMYDTFGSETVAKMSRSQALAYDIVMGEVEDVQESLWILENNTA